MEEKLKFLLHNIKTKNSITLLQKSIKNLNGVLKSLESKKLKNEI